MLFLCYYFSHRNLHYKTQVSKQENTMLFKTVTCLILISATGPVIAENSPYWYGSSGDYVRDRNGHCVRTINWTAEAAIASCEGGEVKKAVQKSAPVRREPLPPRSSPDLLHDMTVN